MNRLRNLYEEVYGHRQKNASTGKESVRPQRRHQKQASFYQALLKRKRQQQQAYQQEQWGPPPPPDAHSLGQSHPSLDSEASFYRQLQQRLNKAPQEEMPLPPPEVWAMETPTSLSPALGANLIVQNPQVNPGEAGIVVLAGTLPQWEYLLVDLHSLQVLDRQMGERRVVRLSTGPLTEDRHVSVRVQEPHNSQALIFPDWIHFSVEPSAQ